MSEGKNIYITEEDRDNLVELIRNARFGPYRGSEYLVVLQRELDRATVVSANEMPGDVITMDSRVVLKDMNTGKNMRYTLVYPDQADASRDRISILAPIGTAMLGYRVGDTFEWKTPGGLCRYQVVEILYQPEAAGGGAA